MKSNGNNLFQLLRQKPKLFNFFCAFLNPVFRGFVIFDLEDFIVWMKEGDSQFSWVLEEIIIIGVLFYTPFIGFPLERLVGDHQILVGDHQIFIDDPQFSLEASCLRWRPHNFRWKTPNFRLRPPDSHWKSPDVHWSPQISVEDPHIFGGDPQIIVGDPYIFVGNSQIFIGDPPWFRWIPPDSLWKYGATNKKNEVSNENLGVSNENMGVYKENLGVSILQRESRGLQRDAHSGLQWKTSMLMISSLTRFSHPFSSFIQSRFSLYSLYFFNNTPFIFQ